MTVFYPKHLNQFTDPNGEPWPGVLNGCNCWATVGAMMVRANTHGHRKPSPPNLRRHSGDTDCPGHIGFIEKGAAYYGVDVTIPHRTSTGWGFGVPWVEVLERLGKDQFVAIPLHYGSLPPDDRAHTTFRGDHMFLLCPPRDGGAVDPHGSIRGDDPLRHKRKRYDLDDIYTAASACARGLGFPKGNVIAAFVKGVEK